MGDMNHHLVLNSYSNQGLITFISRLNVTISIGFQSIHQPAKVQLSKKQSINKGVELILFCQGGIHNLESVVTSKIWSRRPDVVEE